MIFKLTIESESQTFEQPHAEIARILRETAERIEIHQSKYQKLKDINGNVVGEATLVPFKTTKFVSNASK